MTILEGLATLLGLANIALLVRRSIWNYPFGIAMVTLYAWIFYDARLYSDALLQLFFLLLQAYGWVNWARAREESGVPVRWLGAKSVFAAVALAIVAVILWGTMMHRHTNAASPWWDASVAMLSVGAQALLARRFIDNWVWWIAVDLIAIPLYWSKGLMLTAGLYAIFLCMSALGLREWWIAEKAQQA